MNRLLKQIKDRRISLNLKQHDMMMRVGISRQQYQRLESKGNPRLNTLQLISKGLRGELLFIPQKKLAAVLQLLNDERVTAPDTQEKTPLNENPWQGLLDDVD